MKNADSFSGDTLVSTEFGLKPIFEIKIGEKVWAYDAETGAQSLQEVTHLIRGEGAKELVDISLVNGDLITATVDHPFYDASLKKWKNAGQVVGGDIFLTLKGLPEVVYEVKPYLIKTTVYNLTVNNFHTYYVGNNGVLTHNSNACTLPLTSSISMGNKFKDHYARHKGLLSTITGKSYGKVKVSGQEFLDDIRQLVGTGRLKFKGRGTLGKGQPEVNIYSGEGVTFVLKDSNEWVTLLKSGEGLDKAIMMVTK